MYGSFCFCLRGGRGRGRGRKETALTGAKYQGPSSGEGRYRMGGFWQVEKRPSHHSFWKLLPLPFPLLPFSSFSSIPYSLFLSPLPSSIPFAFPFPTSFTLSPFHLFPLSPYRLSPLPFPDSDASSLSPFAFADASPLTLPHPFSPIPSPLFPPLSPYLLSPIFYPLRATAS